MKNKSVSEIIEKVQETLEKNKLGKENGLHLNQEIIKKQLFEKLEII